MPPIAVHVKNAPPNHRSSSVIRRHWQLYMSNLLNANKLHCQCRKERLETIIILIAFVTINVFSCSAKE